MATKFCEICCSEKSPTQMRKGPEACRNGHTEEQRACQQCWMGHLTTEIEAKDPAVIECIFCFSIVSRNDVKKLANDLALKRYDGKLSIPDATHHRCQNRCEASRAADLQHHDPSQHGRVFTCRYCQFQTCTTCDLPEHTNETCSQHQARINSHHAEVEAASSVALSAYAKCPSCETPYKIEGGCGHTVCVGCGYRFCKGCSIPWVGENSQFLLGKKAHAEGCRYRDRDRESRHTLHGRFEEPEDVKERLAERDAKNKEKNEAGKEAKRVAKMMEVGSEFEVEGARKKTKR